MLYKALIGNDYYHSQEFKAFAHGFDLLCKNSFSFKKILQVFEGGPEAFLSMVGISNITSSESLLQYLSIYANESLTFQLQNATNNDTLTFHDLIISYLCGQGAPCPSHLEVLKELLNNLIDFSQINNPGFRSRMLLWAVMGSPLLDSEEDILIYPVGDNDMAYTQQ
ncbi:hypothetical protein C0995_016409, partial [Termitomyces sp. Mi166